MLFRQTNKTRTRHVANNDNFVLEQLMSQLDAFADECNINKCRLKMNDEIFTMCTANEFKVISQKFLKRLTILLLKVPELITNSDEKNELIQKYHNEPLTGGH